MDMFFSCGKIHQRIPLPCPQAQCFLTSSSLLLELVAEFPVQSNFIDFYKRFVDNHRFSFRWLMLAGGTARPSAAISIRDKFKNQCEFNSQFLTIHIFALLRIPFRGDNSLWHTPFCMRTRLLPFFNENSTVFNLVGTQAIL